MPSGPDDTLQPSAWPAQAEAGGAAAPPIKQRLAALFAAALLLFNFPLLALWDHDVALWGLPLFPTALFCLWLLLIAGLALVLERLPD